MSNLHDCLQALFLLSLGALCAVAEEVTEGRASTFSLPLRGVRHPHNKDLSSPPANTMIKENLKLERQLSSPFLLSDEMKHLDLELEPHKRCAFDFLQSNIPRDTYTVFTCQFKGLNYYSNYISGCGYNLDLGEAARLYESNGYLDYQTDAINYLQQEYFLASEDEEDEKRKQWNEFLGYWQKKYICEFLLTNVMKFLDLENLESVAYKQQRCALNYIQYHTQGRAYYKDFTCEYRGASPGCRGDAPLDLEVAASQYAAKPYQIEALNRLQKRMKRNDLGAWSKFITYWRKQEECLFVGAEGKLKILHLGDSYSAGNGADGPEEANQPVGCHRNEDNWGRQLANKLQETCHVQYINRACHGAVASDIINPRNMKIHKKYFPIYGVAPPLVLAGHSLPVVAAGTLTYAAWDVLYGESADCKSFDMDEATYTNYPGTDIIDKVFCYGTVQPQILNVDHSVDLVFLTIGGNDLGFINVILNCMITWWSACECEKALDNAQKLLDYGTVKEAIKDVFKALRDRMRKDAMIIYAAYPHLVLKDTDKKYTCDDEKHEFYAKSTKKKFDVVPVVRRLGAAFENIQKQAVEECNEEADATYIIFYDGTKEDFNGHEPSPRLFAQVPGLFRDLYIHDVGVIDAAEDIAQTSSLDIFEAYHPNKKGQTAWADGIYTGLLSQFNGFCLDAEFDYFKTSLDLAIVLDTTASMSDIHMQVLSRLNSIFDVLQSKTADFRVALVSYKDFSDYNPDPDGYVRPAKVLQHLTTDIEEVRDALYSIRVSGGGDPREAVFSGVYTALHDLSWKAGAVKVMMVIGDAPPKLDTSIELPTEYLTYYTADELIKTSWELDPVQIITVAARTMNSDGVMAKISSATGGMSIDLDDVEALGPYTDLIIDKATQQPFAWIGESYAGRVGESIKFDARGSYDPMGMSIVSYVWDFDGDGVDDQTTTEPQVEHVYDTLFEGFVYVSAVSGYDLVGLASAQVKIYDGAFAFENTLSECDLDDAGRPIIRLGEDGADLACIIKDSLVVLRGDPEFVEACDACLDELDGREEAVMLRNAYGAGNRTEFATILCDLAAPSGSETTSAASKKAKKEPKGGGRGGGLRELKKGSPKRSKEESVVNAGPCQDLLNGAVICPKANANYLPII